MTQVNQVNAAPVWLNVNDDGATVTLKHTINIGGVLVDKVVMRAPCVRDVRAATAAANGDYEKLEMSLFCSLLMASEAELAALKYIDYKRLQAGYFRLVEEDDV